MPGMAAGDPHGTASHDARNRTTAVLTFASIVIILHVILLVMDKALKKYLKDGKFQNVSLTRSKQMGSVKGKGNKTTEKRLRYALVSAGITGWKVQPKHIIGNPDFIFKKEKLAIFVDGCYWHGCPKCGHVPKTRSEFWKAKIDRTKQRDKEKAMLLEEEGYIIVRFWEHELKDNLKKCMKEILILVGQENGIM